LKGMMVKNNVSSKSRTAWTVAIVAAALVMYWPTLAYMWVRWGQDTQYSLAFLVPPICGYFIWKLWPIAKAAECRPSPWGLPIIIGGLLLHLVSAVLDLAILSDFSILAFILGSCLYLRGAVFTKTLWFPLAFLFFAVPIPGGIIDMIGRPLALYASNSTVFLLRLLGMEVAQEGVNLSVPGFDFKVAVACSGMSSLVALIGVTALFAYITRLPAGYRWVLFCLAIPVALAANTVRITTIALVGFWFGTDAAMHMFHDWASPFLFVVAIIILFLISWGFEWLNARRTTS